jgi:hypothetical protein
LNAFDPFAANQEAPTRTDARRRFTLNGTWNAPGGFRLSPVFRYKSKTPFNAITGVDNNLDGLNYDLAPGITTLNSQRGADFKQFDLRLSRFFHVTKSFRFEAIAEGFNVTNAKNPGGFISNMSLPYKQGTTEFNATGFGAPTTFAGDFQRGEQRMFQLGIRFDF